MRGQGEVVQTYYHTHRGPGIEHLFPDLHVKYGFPIPPQYRINHTITLTSAIYDPDKTSFEGLQKLAYCTAFEDF